MLYLRVADFINAQLSLPDVSLQDPDEIYNHSDLELGMEGCYHQEVLVLKQVFGTLLKGRFRIVLVLQLIAQLRKENTLSESEKSEKLNF